jgi:hypothetical protein
VLNSKPLRFFPAASHVLISSSLTPDGLMNMLPWPTEMFLFCSLHAPKRQGQIQIHTKHKQWPCLQEISDLAPAHSLENRLGTLVADIVGG